MLKKTIAFFTFLMFSLSIFAQSEIDPIVRAPEILAHHKYVTDGEFTKFLLLQIHYPAIARENGLQGKVILEFVVEKDGTFSNIKVVKSPDVSLLIAEKAKRTRNEAKLKAYTEAMQQSVKSLEDEAKRVVTTFAPFTPAMDKGAVVRSYYAFPFSFRLE
jgi:TonB family protein